MAQSHPAFHIMPPANFHANRWKCLWNPQRSRDTLRPYAVLKMQVQMAKNLLAKDWNLFRSTSDPYYEISVDDKVYHVSEHMTATLHPHFNHDSIDIPIWHPNSIVRIAIMDWDGMVKRMMHGNEVLGFVEFIIRDLPVNNSVRGWFELRLEEKLVGTADRRVYEHSYNRDEYTAKLQSPNDTGSASSSTLVERNKMRRRSANRGTFARISNYFVDMREDVSHQVGKRLSAISGEPNHRDPLNAGSALVHLELQVENHQLYDEFWAYCLPEPEHRDHPPPIPKGRNVLPELDVDDIVRNGEKIGDVLWGHGLLCVIDSIIYILCWKECWISAVFTTAFVVMSLPPEYCIYSRYSMSIFLGCIALWLLILASKSRRDRMVANPLTAPFDDEGFALIAQLNSTAKMAAWIERMMTKRFHGCVNSHSDLEIFSSQIFKNKKPVMSFDELVAELYKQEPIEDFYSTSPDRKKKKKPWLKFPEHTFKAKAKVFVSFMGRPSVQGQISSLNKDGTYAVISDDGTKYNRVNEANITDDPAAVVPSIPTWLIPDVLENAVRGVQPLIQIWEQSVSDVGKGAKHILTWKSVPLNLFILLVLCGLSAGLVFAKIYVEWLDAALLLAIGAIIFLGNAWWIRIFINFGAATVRYWRYCWKPRLGIRVFYFQNTKTGDDSFDEDAPLLTQNMKSGLSPMPSNEPLP